MNNVSNRSRSSLAGPSVHASLKGREHAAKVKAGEGEVSKRGQGKSEAAGLRGAEAGEDVAVDRSVGRTAGDAVKGKAQERGEVELGDVRRASDQKQIESALENLKADDDEKAAKVRERIDQAKDRGKGADRRQGGERPEFAGRGGKGKKGDTEPPTSGTDAGVGAGVGAEGEGGVASGGGTTLNPTTTGNDTGAGTGAGVGAEGEGGVASGGGTSLNPTTTGNDTGTDNDTDTGVGAEGEGGVASGGGTSLNPTTTGVDVASGVVSGEGLLAIDSFEDATRQATQVRQLLGAGLGEQSSSFHQSVHAFLKDVGGGGSHRGDASGGSGFGTRVDGVVDVGSTAPNILFIGRHTADSVHALLNDTTARAVGSEDERDAVGQVDLFDFEGRLADGQEELESSSLEDEIL